MMRDKTLAKQLKYRHTYTCTSGDGTTIRNIFDCSIYRDLLEKEVVVDGQAQGHKYFSDPRDVALGISLDGVTYFSHRQHSVWPVILVNYNLPPKVRTRRNCILCYGVIPGTMKIWTPTSFPSRMNSKILQRASRHWIRGMRSYSGNMFTSSWGLVITRGFRSSLG